jgi:uncharacterized protein (DUF58 family)
MRIDKDMLHEVARLKLATPGVASGGQHGDRRSSFLGRGVEFADYRPYGPGDDLRLVDWNVYSRLQVVLVRLFHEDRNLTVQICLDASASMGFGEPRKLDFAGELTAALALIALKGRDSVSLSCGGGTGPLTIVKGQNQNAFARILQYLEMVEPQGGDDSIRSIKAHFRGSRPDRLFFISDMLKEEADMDRLLRVMSASAKRPTLLHVLGSEELTPDLRYPQRVIDAETGEELRVMGGRVAEKAYREALEAYLEDLKARCRALRIQYVEAYTTATVAELLNGVMRRSKVVASASGASR